MTLAEFKWRLAYQSNMLVQDSIAQSNAALISILDPRPKLKSTRRKPARRKRG